MSARSHTEMKGLVTRELLTAKRTRESISAFGILNAILLYLLSLSLRMPIWCGFVLLALLAGLVSGSVWLRHGKLLGVYIYTVLSLCFTPVLLFGAGALSIYGHYAYATVAFSLGVAWGMICGVGVRQLRMVLPDSAGGDT